MAMSATAMLLSTAPSACLFQPIMLQYNLGKIQDKAKGRTQELERAVQMNSYKSNLVEDLRNRNQVQEGCMCLAG